MLGPRRTFIRPDCPSIRGRRLVAGHELIRSQDWFPRTKKFRTTRARLAMLTIRAPFERSASRVRSSAGSLGARPSRFMGLGGSVSRS